MVVDKKYYESVEFLIQKKQSLPRLHLDLRLHEREASQAPYHYATKPPIISDITLRPMCTVFEEWGGEWDTN